MRTVILDSGSLLDVRIFEQSDPNAQRALDLLFQRCAAGGAFPDLRGDFACAMARLTH